MAYTWNGDYMWDAATLPSAVGRYLKLAGSTQLLVLLWMATIGRGRGDAESCAADLGGRVSVEDCEDALRFWEDEGLLVKAKSPAADKVAPQSKPAAEEKAAAKKTAETASVKKPAAADLPLKSAVAPRAAVTPTVTTTSRAAERSAAAATPRAAKKPAAPVMQRQRDAEFRLLLESVEMRLGKPLSHADQNRLLDLYDTADLPVGVILMAVAYAVKMDKPKLSYIQAVVRSWEEQGIDSVDTADKHLCHLERIEQAWVQLEQWLDLSAVRPTLMQKTMAEKWLFQWSVSRELLLLAYERCAEKTGKFQASYIDRVLESWRQDGLDTPEKVKAAAKPRRGASAAPDSAAGTGGLNLDQYAAMVQTHTPKYRKKG